MDLQQYLAKENSENVTRCFCALIFQKLSENVTSLSSHETKTRQVNYDVGDKLPLLDDVITKIGFAAQIVNLVKISLKHSKLIKNLINLEKLNNIFVNSRLTFSAQLLRPPAVRTSRSSVSLRWIRW